MWEKYGLIASSTHRQKVLLGLRDGPKKVSDLAVAVEMQLPHVSKALKELEGAGFVKCLTSAQRKGRIYALTKEGKEASLHVAAGSGRISYGELLEREITRVLDEANISYSKNVSIRGAQLEVEPDFVIPSASSPKVVVEALVFRAPTPDLLTLNAYRATDLKKVMKDIKFVLVLGGVSRDKLPTEILKYEESDYFDAMFTGEELQKFQQYVKKHAVKETR